MPTATEITQEPTRLAVKGIKGSIQEEQLGRLRPTPKDTPIEEMRRRLDEDGYLFVKNLIPRADVYNVRKQYVSVSLPCLLSLFVSYFLLVLVLSQYHHHLNHPI